MAASQLGTVGRNCLLVEGINQEQDQDNQTVVDIIHRADLSRNTFYAHYQDVFAVLEELENDFLSEMNHYLDEAIENKEFSDPLSLLQKFQRFVENSIENNRLLRFKYFVSNFHFSYTKFFCHFSTYFSF